MEGDLDEATRRRLQAARAGQDQAVQLRIANLHVGDVGVLDAEVRALASVRTYTRKRGGEGMLQRVTLADATGEIDLVLWDDELQAARDGVLQPGSHVRLHGPLVKVGRDAGSLELGLAGALLVGLAPASNRTLQGLLTAIGPTRPVGNPPALRFTCDLTVHCDGQDVRVVAWDQAVKSALAAGVGTRVRMQGRPNPFLEGWWTADALERAGPRERNP